MTRISIPPEQQAEAKRLTEVYVDATKKVGAALGRYSIDASAPETARTETLRAVDAYRCIREIYGDEATPIAGATSPFVIK
jgi:hypothetical protein